MENNQPGYDLLFNRNGFDNKWYCFTREDFHNYYSNRNNPSARISSGMTQEESFENWKKEYENK
jgi:hypothetical protein